MTSTQPAQSPYCESNSKLQFAWDSTSMGAFKDCPRKYQLSIIEGWQPKHQALPLTFGILYHKGIETFYRERDANGKSYKEAVHETVRYLLHATYYSYEVQKCTDCGEVYKSAPEICRACGNETFSPTTLRAPWETDDTQRNRQMLIRAVVWYCEQYKDSPFKTLILADGSAAVELSFRFELPKTTPGGVPYLWCGHFDRACVDQSDNIWIQDSKSTKYALSSNYFDKYSPDNQMSGYTVGSKVAFSIPAKGVMITAVQLGAEWCRYGLGFAPRTEGQQREWIADILFYIALAQQCAEEDYWPMNDKACHHYGGCQFRGVCSKSPEVREKFLESDFIRRPWNPLETREA